LRSNDGFEDREDHQAPFTLPIADCGLRTAERLLCFFDRLDDLVEIRPIAGVEFGMEQFSIGVNLEGAAARGNQGERFNALAELENFGRQTDGLRRVVSNDAVFDRYLCLHRADSFPITRLSVRFAAVKKRRSLRDSRFARSVAAARSTELRVLHFSNRGNGRGC
jgi:hypothetical protein